MTIKPRLYQSNVIDGVRDAFRRVRRVMVQTPTGGGKTVIAGFIAAQTSARNQSVWFICHRAELVQQTSLTFQNFGIAHAFIAAGYPMNLGELVQICSIDTLKLRLATLTPPKIAIIDEAHHSSAAGWALVIQWLYENGCRIIGLSATPQRLDGQGLDVHFDELVLGPSVAWLIEQGYLSEYEYFAPPPPAKLKAKGADDGRAAQARVMDVPKITDDIVARWREHANGKRTIGFACSVKHSKHMVDAFDAAGIPAAHLDGDTPKADRKRIIQDFAAGRLLVLWNVALFGEGLDLAAIAQVDVTIDCVIMARQTRSLSLYLQMIGRALRPAPGKIAVILDHAGNLLLHKLYPDDEIEWSLAGREKREAANDNGPPPPTICEGCFNAIKKPLPETCPHCGKPLRAEFKEIEVAEGQLEKQTELEKRRLRMERNREQYEAETLDALILLGRKRGYAQPVAWARNVFGRRKRKSA